MEKQEALPLLSSFGPKLLNGAIAGMVGVGSTFPLDLAKTRLQDQRTLKGGKRVYKNMFDCLWKVFKAEGPMGLYKGMGVNIFLINPEKAIKLAVNDQARQFFGGRTKSLPLHLELVSGALAGFCQVIVTTPMEMLKIQMQIAGKQASQGAARISALQLTRMLLKEKGISGLYRGLGATIARDVPFSCVYFPLFAFLNIKGMGPNGEKPHPVHSLVSGCLAGMTGAFSVNPIDVIKTRLQVLKQTPGEQAYTGIMDCFTKILRNEGISAFYKGAVPRMVVIAPLFGISQMVYFVGVAEGLLGMERPGMTFPVGATPLVKEK